MIGAGEGEGEAFCTVLAGAERRETLVGDSTASGAEDLEAFFGALEFLATAIFETKFITIN